MTPDRDESSPGDEMIAGLTAFNDALEAGTPLDDLVTSTLYRCPRCQRVSRWTDGTEAEFWCSTCGLESEAELIREPNL